MKSKFLKASAVVIMAVQPMLSGAATMTGSQIGTVYADHNVPLSVTAEAPVLLFAQNQNQSGNTNQNQNENQNQNQNQSGNANQNQNDNRTNDTPAALAAATADAVTKPNYACFYDSPSYMGGRFCVEPGNEATPAPAGWNDRISSIEIVGKARVNVCTDAGFAGTCEVFTASVDALPKNLNDSISSWKVE